MKAAILTPTGFEIRDEAPPEPADHELLIRTTACGVCSGDVFVYNKRAALAATHSRLGHEGSGIVAAVGAAVTGFAPGDVVTALGLPAYADYYTTLPEKTVRLDPAVDPVMAVGEAIACCVHAGHRFGIHPGDRVAILGAGFMGLMCQQLARHREPGEIVAVEPQGYRREMALTMGANAAVDPTVRTEEDLAAALGEFDVVIEAVGNQAALDLAGRLVRQHGRLIVIGYHQSNDGRRTVDMRLWNWKGIDVINGHVRRQDEKAAALAEGMDLLRTGRLVTAPLVTTYPLTDTERAFRDLAEGREGLFKAVIVMEGS